MQSVHSLIQQELLTGWSSVKRGEQTERGREERTQRKQESMHERKQERKDAPLPFFPFGNQGGEDMEGRRGRSSAARQPNHYTT